jgi:hypothetical protein
LYWERDELLLILGWCGLRWQVVGSATRQVWKQGVWNFTTVMFLATGQFYDGLLETDSTP